MQTTRCPTHIADYVEDASHLFPDAGSEFHQNYYLRCRCGDRWFTLLKSDKASVLARCSNCNSEICIYDLVLYPAATKIAGSESFVQIEQTENAPKKVVVMYEYGELDPDMTFDPNDITWCQIFIENEMGELTSVFDDETA